MSEGSEGEVLPVLLTVLQRQEGEDLSFKTLSRSLMASLSLPSLCSAIARLW